MRISIFQANDIQLLDDQVLTAPGYINAWILEQRSYKKMNRTEKFWDKRAENYEKPLNSHYLNVIGKIRKYLNQSDVVLDYGCATGLVSHEIAGNVKEMHGLDISPKMAEIATTIARERKIENVNFRHGSIFDQSYEEGSLDVILTFNVLHLLEDAPAVVERFNQLLKPGGVFISMTHSLDEKTSFLGIVQFFIRKLGLVPHVKMPKISELRDLITGGGFRIVEAENLSPSPPYAYYVVAQKE
jgi:2-polyprenyl-3-methyl-5-hydroxy-6-metoxy-1,4-benzoquinol methylase